MKLQDTYFKITASKMVEETPLHQIFEVALMAEHPVYQGHFPGEPVCPGVCSMQMIKECAQLMAGRELMINYVKQYRLLSVITPHANPDIILDIALTEDEKEGRQIYKMKAVATDAANAELKFIDLSAELV